MWWFLDFPTLVLIIAAGIQLGLQAFFGWDLTGTIAGKSAPYVFMALGYKTKNSAARSCRCPALTVPSNSRLYRE